MMKLIQKRKFVWAGCTALLLLIAGFWTWHFYIRGPIHRGNIEDLVKAIQPGMTEAEVETLLGGAVNADMQPDVDAWAWLIFSGGSEMTKAKAWGNRDCFILVCFD